MSPANLYAYFGLPTLFILFCMIAVGWIGSNHFVQKPLRWIAGWGLFGCCVAILLALNTWVMNTGHVYNNASIVWPFCLGLVALNGHPSIGVALLVVALMGVENGVYYSLLAALIWKPIQHLPKKSHLE